MTDGPPGYITKQKLPILETVGAVYTTAFSLRVHFMKAATIPLLLSIAIQQGIGSDADDGLLWIAEFLVDLIPYTMFAIACHRLILLGQGSATPTFVPGWESRSWRFLIYLAVLELIVVVSPVLLAEFVFTDFESLDGEGGGIWEEGFDLISLGINLLIFVLLLIGMCLILTPMTYIWARFSFVFPATAVDADFGFVRSWRETRKRGLRLTALIMIIEIPYVAALMALYSGLPDDCQETSTAPEAIGDIGSGCITMDSFPITVIDTGLYYIVIALTVTLFSISFRTCTGWVPGVSTLPAQSGASG